MRIPDINCACGTAIKVKKGVVQVNCRCGRTYRLCKSGEAVLTKLSIQVLGGDDARSKNY